MTHTQEDRQTTGLGKDIMPGIWVPVVWGLSPLGPLEEDQAEEVSVAE